MIAHERFVREPGETEWSEKRAKNNSAMAYSSDLIDIRKAIVSMISSQPVEERLSLCYTGYC